MTRLLRPADIIDATEWYTGVKLDDGRVGKPAQARALAWAAMYGEGFNYTEIGRLFGRDSSTVRKCVLAARVDPAQVTRVLRRARELVNA